MEYLPDDKILDNLESTRRVHNDVLPFKPVIPQSSVILSLAATQFSHEVFKLLLVIRLSNDLQKIKERVDRVQEARDELNSANRYFVATNRGKA